MADDELSKIFADPNFRQLPGIEKIKVLDAYDPMFKTLPLKEKANAVQSGLQSTPMQPLGWGDILKTGAGAVLQSGKEIGAGMRKSLVEGLSNLGDVATLGVTHAFDTPENQQKRAESFRANTPFESGGKWLEQAAEAYFTPIPLGKAKGIWQTLRNVSAEGLKTATLNAVHGGDWETILMAAAIGAGVSSLPEAYRLIGNREWRRAVVNAIPKGKDILKATDLTHRILGGEPYKPPEIPEPPKPPTPPEPFRPNPNISRTIRSGGPPEPEYSPPGKLIPRKGFTPPEPEPPTPMAPGKGTGTKFGGLYKPEYGKPGKLIPRKGPKLPTAQEEVMPPPAEVRKEIARDPTLTYTPKTEGGAPIERPYPAFEQPGGPVKPQYAKAARTVKINVLRRWLKVNRVTHANALKMSDADWLREAKAAGVTPPSKETVTGVLSEPW